MTFIAVTLFDESEWINVACREDFAMIAEERGRMVLKANDNMNTLEEHLVL